MTSTVNPPSVSPPVRVLPPNINGQQITDIGGNSPTQQLVNTVAQRSIQNPTGNLTSQLLGNGVPLWT